MQKAPNRISGTKLDVFASLLFHALEQNLCFSCAKYREWRRQKFIIWLGWPRHDWLRIGTPPTTFKLRTFVLPADSNYTKHVIKPCNKTDQFTDSLRNWYFSILYSKSTEQHGKAWRISLWKELNFCKRVTLKGTWYEFPSQNSFL